MIANRVVKVPTNKVSSGVIESPPGPTVVHHPRLSFASALLFVTNSDHAYIQCSISMPGVPTTVSSREDSVESRDAIHFGKVTGFLQVTKQIVTFGIDIG